MTAGLGVSTLSTGCPASLHTFLCLCYARPALRSPAPRTHSDNRAMAQAFGFSLYQVLLDVGGASGTHCLEAVGRYPQLQAVVYDLPGG
jgi:hypothetical protein